MSYSPFLTVPSLVLLPALPTVQRAHNTVFAHVEQQACRTPEQIALLDPVTDTCLSYRELRRRATHLAHVLAEQGCLAGAVVELCLEREPKAIIAMLALLKQGAAFLPLDPAWSAAHTRFVLTLAQARLVITYAALRETFLALPNVEVLDHLDQPSDLPTLAVFLVSSAHPLKRRWLHLLQHELGKRLQRLFPWLHMPVPLFVCATLPLSATGHLDRERLWRYCQIHLATTPPSQRGVLEVHHVNR